MILLNKTCRWVHKIVILNLWSMYGISDLASCALSLYSGDFSYSWKKSKSNVYQRQLNHRASRIWLVTEERHRFSKRPLNLTLEAGQLQVHARTAVRSVWLWVCERQREGQTWHVRTWVRKHSSIHGNQTHKTHSILLHVFKVLNNGSRRRRIRITQFRIPHYGIQLV